MTLNDDEIDQHASIIMERAPQFAKYAKFLADWRDTVNQNSDGWGIWKPSTQAAATLMAHLKTIVADIRGIRPYSPNPSALPADADFRKSLKPILDAAKHYNLPQPALQGETPRPAATPKATVLPLDSKAFVTVAQRHGEDSEPDHEVGDLQTFFRAAYDLLTPEQRVSFLALDVVRETIESALPIDPLPEGPAAADALREALDGGTKPGPGR